MDSKPSDALRVSQLDASELDQEIVRLTKSQVAQLLKYNTTTYLAKLDPEIQTAIKFLIWKFTLYDREATIGQQILGLKYFSGTHKSCTGSSITENDKLLHGLLVIFCPWLKDRLPILLSYAGLPGNAKGWAVQVENVMKVAALLNILDFLFQGVHLSLVERVLGIRSKFRQQQGLRQVGFEFMTRELMWHGFAEFLFFLLPLINFQRIKNTLNRWVKGQNLSSAGHVQHRQEDDLKVCAICSEWPVLPREIGCRHIFCYYCISANFLTDPNYRCPQCDHVVLSESNIQIVKSHINPDKNYII